MGRQNKVPALRPDRRRTFCEDGAQRHRVWPDGRVRGRVEHSAARQCRAAHRVTTPKRRRYANRSIISTISICETAEVWRRGSVVASWLLDLTAPALSKSPTLATFGARIGFGRRSLDNQCRDRGRRAGAGAQRCAVSALQLARRGGLRRQASVRDALRIRRTRGETEGVTIATL